MLPIEGKQDSRRPSPRDRPKLQITFVVQQFAQENPQPFPTAGKNFRFKIFQTIPAGTVCGGAAAAT
jgi:hypothetical protein